MRSSHQKYSGKRGVALAVAGLLIAAVIAAAFVIRSGAMRDGRPDDRLLAAMQDISWQAQGVLDETGQLPASMGQPDSGVTYEVIGASHIRLCGAFERASDGQTQARPYFDFTVDLDRALTIARPRAGRHCYDVSLVHTDPGVRADALTFRDTHAVATAAECAFLGTGAIPATIDEATRLSSRRQDDPSCRDLDHAVQSDLEYAPVSASSIRVCARFAKAFASEDQRMRVFDPRWDSRFAELAEPRDAAGRRCYTIEMRQPDPPSNVLASWDEPIDLDDLPASLRAAAIRDDRAIGDVVSVLRLARCAYTLSEAVPPTFDSAVREVARRQRVAERYECGWAPDYFGDPNNAPRASYEPLEDGRIRSCATFEAAWERPLQLNFYGGALTEWPTSLPELQRPISSPGRHCFTVQLTAIGSGGG